MNSEAETAGRQAVMAWRITTGSFDGVRLDGLKVVAAVAADRNLGMREMGGEEPQFVRAVITVDPTTSDEQRLALVQFARKLSRGLITEIVRIDVAPVRFGRRRSRGGEHARRRDAVGEQGDVARSVLRRDAVVQAVLGSAHIGGDGHRRSARLRRFRPRQQVERAEQAVRFLGFVRLLIARIEGGERTEGGEGGEGAARNVSVVCVHPRGAGLRRSLGRAAHRHTSLVQGSALVAKPLPAPAPDSIAPAVRACSPRAA